MDAYFDNILTASADQLSKFNKLDVIFTPASDSSRTITDILLQVKTIFNIESPIIITNNLAQIDYTSNTTKLFKKVLYKKQNKLLLMNNTNKGKSNLFGWHPDEDAQVYDIYISQPPVARIKANIVSIDEYDEPCAESSGESGGKSGAETRLIFVKSNVVDEPKYNNICKDSIMEEMYISYELSLDSAYRFIIKQYYAAGGIYNKTIICLECCFNEEYKVMPQKIKKAKHYIQAIKYIVN